MVRTIIHGARMEGGGRVCKWGSAYRYQISILLLRGGGGGGGGVSGKGLLVLPPRCEIFLVTTLPPSAILEKLDIDIK